MVVEKEVTMTRNDLVHVIRNHEARCSIVPGAYFSVVAVQELADGVLAVQETDGEHTIYFDKSRFRVPEGSAFKDMSQEVRDFPSVTTGFIEDVMARGWGDIAKTAKLALATANGGKTKWHRKPLAIKYRA